MPLWRIYRIIKLISLCVVTCATFNMKKFYHWPRFKTVVKKVFDLFKLFFFFDKTNAQFRFDFRRPKIHTQSATQLLLSMKVQYNSYVRPITMKCTIVCVHTTDRAGSHEAHSNVKNKILYKTSDQLYLMRYTCTLLSHQFQLNIGYMKIQVTKINKQPYLSRLGALQLDKHLRDGSYF